MLNAVNAFLSNFAMDLSTCMVYMVFGGFSVSFSRVLNLYVILLFVSCITIYFGQEKVAIFAFSYKL